MYRIFLILILCALGACTPAVRFTSANTNAGSIPSKQSKSTDISSNKAGNVLPVGTKFRGKASYYHDKFDGRLTANGETFSQTAFTAAHRELAFGTMVKVRRISNNKTVVVRINDRGPFAEGRIIDLSYAAAEAIDLIDDGVAEVEIEVTK